MPTNVPYTNSVISPTGGTNAFSGQGQEYTFTLSLTGTAGRVTITLTDQATGIQYQVGAGNVTGLLASFLFVFGNRVYTLGGSTFFFTALAQPTVWNYSTDLSNGFFDTSNYYSTPENLAAIAVYQGKLAFYARRNVQIWQVDSDPANFQLIQVLPNIGTVAPLSVKAVGDMDIYALSDNGVRSVRVRDASNNAIIADVGTPIDAILQPILAGLTDAQKVQACGIVEPSSNRYWCYVPAADGGHGYIYVFSYFPDNQIAAWSRYDPTWLNGSTKTNFTPEKFVVYNGQVWVRGKDEAAFYQYGGANNVTYENCGVTWRIPYLSADSPSTLKMWNGADAAMEGTWAIGFASDFTTDIYKRVCNYNKSTFQLQHIGFQATSTHYSFEGVESSSGYARFSSILVHYKQANEKGA